MRRSSRSVPEQIDEFVQPNPTLVTMVVGWYRSKWSSHHRLLPTVPHCLLQAACITSNRCLWRFVCLSCSIMTNSEMSSTLQEHHELVDLDGNHKDIGSFNYNERNDWRSTLARLLNSYRFHVSSEFDFISWLESHVANWKPCLQTFQIAILVLVGVDCFLVFGELIIDLKLFQNHTCYVNSSDHQTESESHHTLETIEKVRPDTPPLMQIATTSFCVS